MEKNKFKNNNKKKKQKRLSIFTYILIALVIIVIIGLYYGIRNLIITLKYKEYTQKVYEYGYSDFYDNKKATSTQKVTNNELIKVLIGSINNTDNIDDLYYFEKDEKNKWFTYFSTLELNNKITEEDLSKRATKLDAIIIATNIVEDVIKDEIKVTELNYKDSILKKLTPDEQKTLGKAVTLGFLDNKNSDMYTRKLNKGELNKFVITIVEKYATMYYKIGDENVKLVTEEKDKPANYKDYPYIVDNIDKEIYELDYKILTKTNFQTPKQAYKIMGNLYMQTDELLNRYFDAILNVDYRTINVENFLESIRNDVVYEIDKEDVQDYVNYVKKNKIKLQGKVDVLLPIMYNNGEQYVIRTKVEFKVINSNTQYSLLFGDVTDEVKYNSNDIVMYVDVPTGMTLNAYSLKVYISSLAGNLAKPTNAITLNKEETQNTNDTIIESIEY